VNNVYGETRLTFGREYIVPKPFDSRLISSTTPAFAKAGMESGVAKMAIVDWDKCKLLQRSGNGTKVVRIFNSRTKVNAKRIVFAEVDPLDFQKSAQIAYNDRAMGKIKSKSHNIPKFNWRKRNWSRRFIFRQTQQITVCFSHSF
jgi:malate dehydrogenase (oxaloacetate-decarboxylating)(NADP+)